MTLQIKNKYLVLAFSGAFLATFLLGGYIGLHKKDSASNEAQIALNEEIRQYKYQLDSINKVAYQKQQEILSLREAIKKGNIEKAELRKLNFRKVNEVTKLKLVIDSLLHIEPNDSIIIDTVYIKDKPVPAIVLPYIFKENNKFFTLRGVFDKKGALDLSIKMQAKLDVWTGIKDKEYTTIVTSDNPFLNVSELNSMKFDLPKPKKWAIGIVGGYGMTTKNLSPFTGIGLMRTMIRF